MISFIVIGRNESWKLSKCIQSILNAVRSNAIRNYEVFYIDSDSSDNSIDEVKKFDKVQIIKLTGEVNAAIARNLGAKEAKGEVLFFIDGDMEIKNSFLPLVYSEDGGLIRDYVSGNWTNYFYDENDILLSKENYSNQNKDVLETTTGGLFLILKNTWDEVGGMNIKFKKSQDIDLGLRLAQKGIYLLRKKEIAAIHHTVSYTDNKRMWMDLYKGNHLYSRSLLYRLHVLNSHVYNRILRNDYPLIIILFLLISFFVDHRIWIFLLVLYFLVIYSRGKFQAKYLPYFLIRDVTSFLGFFLFYVKKPHYQVIKIR